MAFSYTKTASGYLQTKPPRRKIVFGTFTTTGTTTGGDIVTGLKSIEYCWVVDKTGNRAGMAIDTTTTPGTITVSGLTAQDVGFWMAIGR